MINSLKHCKVSINSSTCMPCFCKKSKYPKPIKMAQLLSKYSELSGCSTKQSFSLTKSEVDNPTLIFCLLALNLRILLQSINQ